MSYPAETYIRRKLVTASKRALTSTVILFDARPRGETCFARVDNRANAKTIAFLRRTLPVIGTYRATEHMIAEDIFELMIEDCQHADLFTIFRRRGASHHPGGFVLPGQELEALPSQTATHQAEMEGLFGRLRSHTARLPSLEFNPLDPQLIGTCAS